MNKVVVMDLVNGFNVKRQLMNSKVHENDFPLHHVVAVT